MPFRLFERVRLVRDVTVAGESLPRGALGKVIDDVNCGEAYVVAFHVPHRCVATIYADLLTRTPPVGFEEV
jgi:hypothetical protein